MNENELVAKHVYNSIEKLLKHDMGIANFTINITPGTNRGDNYLGIIAKVEVNGVDKRGKRMKFNLITKSAPQAEGFRSIMPVRQAYTREIYVYSKVLPQLIKFQQKRNVVAPFKCFPKYYLSTEEEFNEVLVMEDMKELGYQLCDRQKPLDVNHILLVLKEYGKLHALSFAIRDQDPESFQQLSDNLQETYFSSITPDNMVNIVKAHSEKALNSLDPNKEKLAYQKYEDFCKNMAERVMGSLEPGAAGEHAVITHGDCWMNNYLFKYGNSVKPDVPTDLCLLDWQLSHLGSPALDLSYFLFTCSDKNTRDQHYDRFIQEYYDSLSSMLRNLGSDPDKLFPFDVLQKHLKRFSVYSLYLATTLLFLMLSEREEIPELHKVTDSKHLAEVFECDNQNTDEYSKRIRGVIFDFIKYNYDF